MKTGSLPGNPHPWFLLEAATWGDSLGNPGTIQHGMRRRCEYEGGEGGVQTLKGWVFITKGCLQIPEDVSPTGVGFCAENHPDNNRVVPAS